jgi:hypothetical protein
MNLRLLQIIICSIFLGEFIAFSSVSVTYRFLVGFFCAIVICTQTYLFLIERKELFREIVSMYEKNDEIKERFLRFKKSGDNKDLVDLLTIIGKNLK